MSGHVFIVRGDITRIACDAWLLPSDERFTLTPAWWHRLPDELSTLLVPGNDRRWR